MIEPHGGTLINRVVGDEHEANLRSHISEQPKIDLDLAEYQDLINISNGRYSPLDGFLSHNDFLKVVNDMALEDGTVWPLPIVLDVSSEKAETLQPGQTVGLNAPEGRLVGTITIEDVYKYSVADVAKGVFGTDDTDHPGIQNLHDRGDFLVGGDIHMFDEERYNDYDLLPKETRVLFQQRGWETIVGFQTRNAPHRAHEYIQKSGLELTDGLLVQPKLGAKKQGDYCDDVILGSYRTLFENYYPSNRATLSVFPSRMNYAGPREAVFDALVRKNQGCSHFVIGRDHAGVGNYYGEFEAQEIIREIGDVGITPLFYDYSFYCSRCDGMTSEKICPHSKDEQIHPSGTKIRNMIQSGSQPSEKIMRPEVAQYVMEADEPFITQSVSQEGGS